MSVIGRRFLRLRFDSQSFADVVELVDTLS